MQSRFYFYMTIKQSLHPIFSRATLYCLISAAGMICSFPTLDWWLLAWFSLIPFLFVLENKNLQQAWVIGFWTGYIFFLGTLYWLMHVTVVGMLLVVAYMAVYWGIFALGFVWISQNFRRQRWFLSPALWVALEFARAHLLTGFDWGSLGYGQFRNRVIIQIADIFGQYGISFLVVMTNVVILDGLLAWKKDCKEFLTDFSWKISVGLLVCTLGYGLWQVREMKESSSLRIAVVQGNIEQEMKWDESHWPEIMAKHMTLSDAASHLQPDLIIWPETAFPGQLWDDLATFAQIQDFVKSRRVPLLLGTITHDDDKYYNSALMLTSDAVVAGVYHKMHLVPFGEFVPFRSVLGGVADFIPIVDFTAGKVETVFPAPLAGEVSASLDDVMVRLKKSSTTAFNTSMPVKGDFGVLICFEDAFAENARNLVRNGAQWLVTITNDAWFKNSKAPFMHLSASVLRAVETRRPVVRAANTGISAFINAQGRVTRYVANDEGQKTFIAGVAFDVISPRRDMTLYTRLGDVFAWMCVLTVVGILLTSGLRRLNIRI